MEQEKQEGNLGNPTAQLVEKLGGKLTAYIAGVRKTSIIGDWIRGADGSAPDEKQQKRLDAAFEWVSFLTKENVPTDEIQIRAQCLVWYDIGEMSPAKLFRNIDQQEPEKAERLIQQAKEATLNAYLHDLHD